MRYLTEPKCKKYVKIMAFCQLQENMGINGYCNKNRNRCCKKKLLKEFFKKLLKQHEI